jgi:hypothetical protein
MVFRKGMRLREIYDVLVKMILRKGMRLSREIYDAQSRDCKSWQTLKKNSRLAI